MRIKKSKRNFWVMLITLGVLGTLLIEVCLTLFGLEQTFVFCFVTVTALAVFLQLKQWKSMYWDKKKKVNREL